METIFMILGIVFGIIMIIMLFKYAKFINEFPEFKNNPPQEKSEDGKIDNGSEQ